jgi:ethanolamine permease
MARNMPKALATAIGVAFVIGMCVLLIATGGTGADRLATVDDPLFAAITANPGRGGALFMARLVGAGALVALLGTFFSLAYASSRQFYHLAQAAFLPRPFGRVNARQAPAAAVFLVGVIALATAAFPPNSAMVVFIFLISEPTAPSVVRRSRSLRWPCRYRSWCRATNSRFALCRSLLRRSPCSSCNSFG